LFNYPLLEKLNVRKKWSLIFTVTVLLFNPSAFADKARDVSRLLKVSRTEQQFEAAALAQTRDLLRTYQSIVYRQIQLNLPESLKRQIITCYNDVFNWKKFEPGIIRIMSNSYMDEEIETLTNYYRNRSVAPMHIETLRMAMSKSASIQQQSVDFIFKNSESCLDQDVELITAFVGEVEANTTAAQRSNQERLVPELFRRALKQATENSALTN